MADLTIPKNNKGFDLTFGIKENDGTTVYDVTGYVATLKVWPPGGTSIISGTCVLTTPTSGTVTYTVGAADFATVKIYDAEIELTKSGVIEDSMPFTIEVTESV